MLYLIYRSSHHLLCTGTAVCDGDTFSVACPTGSTVNITGAFWGRASATICPNNQVYSSSDLKCGATNATLAKAVQCMCNGKNSCEVSNDFGNALAGDPCPGER